MTTSTRVLPTKQTRIVAAFGAVSAGVGAATVVLSARVSAAVTASTGSAPDPRIVRVLGARQLVQGLATMSTPTRATLILGSAADVAHALSMLPLIAFSPRFRRPASISAAAAAGSALVAAGLARRTVED